MSLSEFGDYLRKREGSFSNMKVIIIMAYFLQNLTYSKINIIFIMSDRLSLIFYILYLTSTGYFEYQFKHVCG